MSDITDSPAPVPAADGAPFAASPAQPGAASPPSPGRAADSQALEIALAAPYEITFHDVRAGIRIEYLTGEQVISRLLEVLGPCGWSFRILEHEGYADNWEEIGDLWSLKPVFLLSWALMEDPYGPLRDEFVQDDLSDDDQASADRLCDEARAAVAHLAGLPAQELFAGVPPDGFPADHLHPRFTATCWEPLLWAAPWLWRASGNPFLDRDDDDYPEPEPWSASSVFRLTAQYREAGRIMRAIDGFNSWLEQAPGERSSAAIQAARCPPSDRISTLLDLPVADCHDECSCPRLAPVP
jgi:hypothetical protein